ncbi:MAG: hypothetical protein V1777_02340 [Candidatus Micrarchaeota archaeon]
MLTSPALLIIFVLSSVYTFIADQSVIPLVLLIILLLNWFLIKQQEKKIFVQLKEKNIEAISKTGASLSGLTFSYSVISLTFIFLELQFWVRLITTR